MIKINASVGRGGANRPKDVAVIQKLLNLNIEKLSPMSLLAEDSKIGAKTINLISRFQRRILNSSRPDGRIDPNAKTFETLSRPTRIGSNFPQLTYYMYLDKIRHTSNFNNVGIVSKSSPFWKVSYKNNLPVPKRVVSEYSMDIIRLALKKAGMPEAVITSTIRTPNEQANIMYKYEKKGNSVKYKSPGEAVKNIYKTNKNKKKSEIIQLMQTKIEALGKLGKRVSKHCVSKTTYSTLNIIDIGVNSTELACGKQFSKKKFTNAIEELVSNGYIELLEDETNRSNSCWHIEIKVNKKPISNLLK